MCVASRAQCVWGPCPLAFPSLHGNIEASGVVGARLFLSPSIPRPSHMSGRASVCPNSLPGCGKTRLTRSPSPTLDSHSPTPHTNRARGYCSRGPSPLPPRPAAQALVPLPRHEHVEVNAIMVLLCGVWSFLLLGLTRVQRLDNLIRSICSCLSVIRIVFHAQPVTHPVHPPHPLQSTQRQDGPTTGGAGPGGRGLRLGLRAHAPPFHRRATSAR